MKDTKNRHYIKRPKYAPTRIYANAKQYHFAMAYIDSKEGLVFVYKTKERAHIVRGLFGEVWKKKDSLYLHYTGIEYMLKKYGITSQDVLRTEAENGYTRHIELILNGLGQKEWPREQMEQLLAIARKAKQ